MSEKILTNNLVASKCKYKQV